MQVTTQGVVPGQHPSDRPRHGPRPPRPHIFLFRGPVLSNSTYNYCELFLINFLIVIEINIQGIIGWVGVI